MKKNYLTTKKLFFRGLILVLIFFTLKVNAQLLGTCANPDPLLFGVLKNNMSTCGMPNNFSQADACGNRFMNSFEYVFSYTPDGTLLAPSCISINVAETNNASRGLFIFDGCPDTANCIAQAIPPHSLLGHSIGIDDLQLTSGWTYYIVVSSETNCHNFNIVISAGEAGICNVPSQIGDNCSNSHDIPLLPFNESGLTTCGARNDYNMGNISCYAQSNNLNGEDYVFKYSPVNDECISITLNNTQSPSGLFVLGGCPTDPHSPCIASDFTAPGQNTNPRIPYIALGAGKTYYIIVSSMAPAPGCTDFDIFVNQTLCCGTGSTCYDPEIILSLPLTKTAQTICSSCNDYNSKNTPCNNSNFNYLDGDDHVYQYTPSVNECISIDFTADGLSSFAVFDGCPEDIATNCITWSPHQNNPDGIAFLTAGQTYYIVYGKVCNAATYDINITNSTTGAGSTCNDPFPITGIPFNHLGTTACSGNDYNLQTVCGGGITMNGEDFVFVYNSPGNENVSINASGAWIGVLDNCPDNPNANCLGSNFGSSSSLCNVTFANAGSYFIVIDKPFGASPFDISIQTTPRPGQNCMNPYSISNIPFNQTGFTTACYGNDYNNTAACGSNYMNGEEFVFEYTATIDECLQVTGSNLSGRGGIFLMNGCPDDPTTACLAHLFCNSGIGCDTISFKAGLSPGTYYIVVSSNSTSVDLNFDLSIQATSYDATITPVNFCPTQQPGSLKAVDAGGFWSGTGITDVNTGMFHPDSAGIGAHTIIYSIGSGACAASDTVLIEVSNDYCCYNNCNLGFECGNFYGWEGTTGICCPIIAPIPGFVNNRHSIITGSGMDFFTGGVLPMVPPGGGTYSARLGNSGIGSQAETLKHTFTVTPDKPIFGFQYAVVLQDGDHTPADQARFEVSMTDALGIIIPCGTVDFIALTEPPAGFQNGPFLKVQYKPWSTAAIDLTTYIGQEVSIEFRSGDCALGEHFGYGYIDGLCEPLEINGNNFCAEDTIVLLAPAGFQAYEWDTDPAQYTQSIKIADPQDGDTYSVTLTPSPGLGCPVVLTTTLNLLNVITYAGENDTICTGNTYTLAGTIGGDAHYVTWQTTGSGTFDDDTLLIATYTPSVDDITTGSAELIITAFDSAYTCSISDTMILTIRNKFNITFGQQNVSCFGGADGQIIVNVSGGDIPYAYSWSPAVSSNDTAANLSAGIYDFTVSDSEGCSHSQTFTITDPESITATIESINVSCNGGSDGAAIINVSGGTAPYTYTWFPSVGNGNAASNLGAGAYNIIISDINNCIDTFNLTITEPDPLAFNTSGDTVICLGEYVVLTATANGGISPYSFTWDPGAFNASSITVSPEETSIYTASVTDANGCKAESAPITVTVHHLPVVSFTADPESGCAPLCVLFNNKTPDTDIVTWSFGDGQTGIGTSITHCYTDPGTYTVALVVASDKGCIDTLFAPGLIKVFPNPVADFSTTPPHSAAVSSPVLFNDQSTGATHWFWNFGSPEGNNSTSTLKDPTFSYVIIGTYTVSLHVTSDKGCTDSISHTIIIEPEFTLYIPNAFTPDNDGVNDFFAPKGAEFSDFEMEIFNRWGERIYHTTDIDRPWNGRTNNENEIQQGVYVYKIRVKDFKDEIHYYVGNVTLIK